MHLLRTDGSMQACDSGLQDVCERFCWFYFRRHRNPLVEIIGVLQIGGRQTSLVDATDDDVQEWLGSSGWLGCGWANMVTLFILIVYPQLQERL